jgi:hypothetical protein
MPIFLLQIERGSSQRMASVLGEEGIHQMRRIKVKKRRKKRISLWFSLKKN